ncbi:TerC family protein [Candidatus Kapabacteria bacterium]|nr:TerC family protein [Candidatus Kapabacteria bacterium]
MDILFWGGFLIFIGFLLFLDLGVFNKGSHEVSTKEALTWTFIWIGVSLLFNVFIYFAYENQWIHGTMEGVEAMSGSDASLKFLTGYIIEKSLSLDNIFVIAIIFSYFKVPLKYQHEILFWGILGAIIFRGLMIVLGVALIQEFEWIMLVFGVLLIVSAIKMFSTDEEEDYNADKNFAIKIAKKLFPVAEDKDGKFFVKINAKRHITPLFICLLVIETTDIMFAIDSIPAIFSITTDAFIVFSSNIFAILGLRSLYFVLAAMMNQFKYIQISLVFVLGYVGVKMILIYFGFHIDTLISLSVIIGTISIGVVASILKNRKGRTT